MEVRYCIIPLSVSFYTWEIEQQHVYLKENLKLLKIMIDQWIITGKFPLRKWLNFDSSKSSILFNNLLWKHDVKIYG